MTNYTVGPLKPRACKWRIVLTLLKDCRKEKKTKYAIEIVCGWQAWNIYRKSCFMHDSTPYLGSSILWDTPIVLFFFKIFFFFEADHFLKSLIELVTMLLLFYVLDFWSQAMWDLSSPTRDRSCAFWIGMWSLKHWIIREVHLFILFIPVPGYITSGLFT